MKKTILMTIAGLLLVPAIVLSSMVSSTVYAACAEHTIDDGNGGCRAMTATELLQEGRGAADNGDSCLFTTKNTDGTIECEGIFTKIINTALFIIGALSVIMLIYGGVRYTISAGDAKQVESAKNTILYAIIGIVIALLAGAIVNFVLTSLV